LDGKLKTTATHRTAGANLGYNLTMTLPEMLQKVTTVLPGGELVTIRPIRPGDAPLLQAGYRTLSAQTIYLRFFDYAKELTDAEAAHLACVDYRARMAFVATVNDDAGERIIGVARYEMPPADAQGCADCAIVVGDRYHGQGLGSMLLKQLAAYARAQGVHTFLGSILPGNAAIMRFVERSGLPYHMTHAAGGVLQIRIALDPTGET
jgi:acetyltransferase